MTWEVLSSGSSMREMACRLVDGGVDTRVQCIPVTVAKADRRVYQMTVLPCLFGGEKEAGI